jgi:hypothetical protein
MNFSYDLIWIRRYLRDPEEKIWDTALLIELFNQAQHDLQFQTDVLQDVAIISSPPKYAVSYLHDCESAFLDGTAYRALRQQQNFFACTARFEAQEFFNIDGDITDTGTAAFTHPHEAWIVDPNVVVRFPLPENFSSDNGLFYDRRAIEYRDKKAIQLSDPSWETRSGEPLYWYRDDENSNQFVPYPRPSSASWNDETGSGMVTSVADDTTSSEDGTIIQRTGSVLSNDLGVGVVVLDTDDNFTLIYDVSPRPVETVSDAVDWPDFLRKYVRFRTLELAYGSNTDGRISSLRDFWGKRYKLGIEAVQKYLANKLVDRVYRLKTHDRAMTARNHKHLRLPNAYPAI